MVMSHKILLRCHRLRTPLARSRGLLGSRLEGDHHYIVTPRSGRAGGERRTAAAPVYCRGRFAVSSAREVGERSERLNLAGGEGGDTLTVDCACMDESNEHESESRQLQQDHDRRGKGKNESALTG